jgi:hypothetical protein
MAPESEGRPPIAGFEGNLDELADKLYLPFVWKIEVCYDAV